jgi:lipopolysaccharide export LptBFGC system permease protein LptF
MNFYLLWIVSAIGVGLFVFLAARGLKWLDDHNPRLAVAFFPALMCPILGYSFAHLLVRPHPTAAPLLAPRIESQPTRTQPKSELLERLETERSRTAAAQDRADFWRSLAQWEAPIVLALLAALVTLLVQRPRPPAS